jgi:hypothetical protein
LIITADGRPVLATLELTGDTTETGNLTVWGGATVRSVEWNGRFVAVAKAAVSGIAADVLEHAPGSGE